MLPEAPGLLSTITGWPSARPSGSVIRRAVKSVVPPGAVGTTSVMARCGNLPWAQASCPRIWRLCMLLSPLLLCLSALAGSSQFGDLDQVQVWVAHIDRADLLRRARAHHRAFDDGPGGGLQAFDHLGQRHGGDEAQVQRAGHRQVGLGLELAAPHMQVDLLLAELEGFAFYRWRATDEALQLQAQHA